MRIPKTEKKYQFTSGGGQKERCVKETPGSSMDSRQGEINENPEPETGIITARVHCGNKGDPNCGIELKVFPPFYNFLIMLNPFYVSLIKDFRTIA